MKKKREETHLTQKKKNSARNKFSDTRNSGSNHKLVDNTMENDLKVPTKEVDGAIKKKGNHLVLSRSAIPGLGKLVDNLKKKR